MPGAADPVAVQVADAARRLATELSQGGSPRDAELRPLVPHPALRSLPLSAGPIVSHLVAQPVIHGVYGRASGCASLFAVLPHVWG